MAGNIQAIELLNVSTVDSRNKPGSGWQIRVVQWVKDGKSVGCKLESGEFWTDAASGEMRFKAKGFSAKDLDTCNPHWSKIMDLLRNPPPVTMDQSTVADPNEVPF